MCEVIQQWRYPQGLPLDASCSYTSCCPIGCAVDMAHPSTDQHEGGAAVREADRYTCTAADIPVEPPETIVGADAGPVFARKSRGC